MISQGHFFCVLSPITLQWLKSDLKPDTHSPDGNSRTSEQITSETGKGHWFSIARKTSDNCICRAEITRTLILHFIRKPDEGRMYTTDVRRTITQRGDSRERNFPLQDCGGRRCDWPDARDVPDPHSLGQP